MAMINVSGLTQQHHNVNIGGSGISGISNVPFSPSGEFRKVDDGGGTNGKVLCSPTNSQPSISRNAAFLMADDVWPVGTEVVAAHEFLSKSTEDLAIQKDDVLVITGVSKDGHWYRARRRTDGSQGMVPANYVKHRGGPQSPKGLPWFHGHISREDAEIRLRGKPNGHYLVRESTNFPGDYTLCLSFQSKVEHYRIQRKNNLLTCDEEEFFETLTQLIMHYSRDADGLCHRLVSPVMAPESTDVVDGKTRPRHIGLDTVDSPVESLKSTPSFEAIKRQDLTLGDTIGKGEFGDVLIGKLKGEKVAVKGLRQSNQVVRAMLEEAALMTSLRHKNLVRLLGVVMGDSTDVYLVMEYMTNGSLIDYLRSRGRQQVTKRQQINFACDACEGMAYLESKNLVHRDLAARNILLAEDMTAKVSDFGLAKPVDVDKPDDASGKFPIKWTAPEALRFSKFTCKSDVWSFGILLWEIYSFGRVPYPRIPVQEVVQHIEKGYRMEAPEGCPPEITEIMKEAWNADPERRPSFKKLLVRLRSHQSNTA